MRAALRRRKASPTPPGARQRMPGAVRTERRGHRRAGPLGPGQHRLVQPLEVRLNPLDAQLEQQAEGRVEPGEVLVRQRDELEAAGVGAEGVAVAGEPREVVGALERHPARHRRAELADQLTPHVDEARAPRREQPLLPAAGQHVDRDARRSTGSWPTRLNGVHHELRARAPGGGGERGEVHPVAVAELHQRDRQRAHPRVLEPLEQPRLVRPARGVVGTSSTSIPDLAQPEPGIDVRRETRGRSPARRRPG